MSNYIRLRGLPWQVTPEEILDFLKGVNVVGGVEGIHLVTSKADGKNTGEAFVLLESEQDEEEAFKHNKEMLGHRYIEIFSASTEEAEYALRKPSRPSTVVKLRGLPYKCTEGMITTFFFGLEIKRNRLLIVTDRRGRAIGEAYVQFVSKEDTENALKRNRDKIGHRYIEIFRSSLGEMRRQSNVRSVGPYDKKDRGGSRGGDRDFGRGRGSIDPREIWATNGGGGGGGGGGNMGGGNFGNGGGRFNDGGSNNFGDFNNFGNNRNPFGGDNSFDGPFNSNRNSGGGGGGGGNFGSSMFGSGSSGMNDNIGGRNNSMGGGGGGFGPIGGSRNEDSYCVHMRGLPYFCFESDVYRFFEPLRPTNVKIIYNNKGLHSGTADAYFEDKEEAMQAMKKHREQMGNRYIELFFDGQTNKSGFSRRI